ncbi:unnamed protein product [Phytophthora lilii]|uniref:Unnamed protein product n=1 Tax=Phytophthora lilii TaxID=2077276 RepID=A0A9W6TDN4_9STRA|nr:unnamed protein product [Phytophthora lilii]
MNPQTLEMRRHAADSLALSNSTARVHAHTTTTSSSQRDRAVAMTRLVQPRARNTASSLVVPRAQRRGSSTKTARIAGTMEALSCLNRTTGFMDREVRASTMTQSTALSCTITTLTPASDTRTAKSALAGTSSTSPAVGPRSKLTLTTQRSNILNKLDLDFCW